MGSNLFGFRGWTASKLEPKTTKITVTNWFEHGNSYRVRVKPGTAYSVFR